MNRNSPRIVQRPMMGINKYQIFLIDSVRIRDSKFLDRRTAQNFLRLSHSYKLIKPSLGVEH